MLKYFSCCVANDQHLLSVHCWLASLAVHTLHNIEYIIYWLHQTLLGTKSAYQDHTNTEMNVLLKQNWPYPYKTDLTNIAGRCVKLMKTFSHLSPSLKDTDNNCLYRIPVRKLCNFALSYIVIFYFMYLAPLFEKL